VNRALILNAGSSTLKWVVLDAPASEVLDKGVTDWSAKDTSHQSDVLRNALKGLDGIDAIGHRVVHGGTRFSEAVIVNSDVRSAIQDLVPLAPLHNPAAIAGIDASRKLFPEVPHVAAFDTAFHTTIPDAAAIYPLPWEWTERWGLRRLGFHGLSVQYAVQRTTELLTERPKKLVVCHLGAGCSITAVADGHSVDTTMGFTPLEGVMMAVRSGDVDPGMLLYLLREKNVDLSEMEATLNGRSGLLGTSGVSADLRQVIGAAQAGNERATLAIDVFVHRVVKAVGGMVGVLGGLDCLVFTAGIGENSPLIRDRVTAQFAHLDLRLDPAANANPGPDVDIATPDSTVRALVIAAREDLAILTDMRKLLWQERL
jgi:acetate kinase